MSVLKRLVLNPGGSIILLYPISLVLEVFINFLVVTTLIFLKRTSSLLGMVKSENGGGYLEYWRDEGNSFSALENLERKLEGSTTVEFRNEILSMIAMIKGAVSLASPLDHPNVEKSGFSEGDLSTPTNESGTRAVPNSVTNDNIHNDARSKRVYGERIVKINYSHGGNADSVKPNVKDFPVKRIVYDGGNVFKGQRMTAKVTSNPNHSINPSPEASLNVRVEIAYKICGWTPQITGRVFDGMKEGKKVTPLGELIDLAHAIPYLRRRGYTGEANKLMTHYTQAIKKG